jgi:hypothetical protein
MQFCQEVEKFGADFADNVARQSSISSAFKKAVARRDWKRVLGIAKLHPRIIREFIGAESAETAIV